MTHSTAGTPHAPEHTAPPPDPRRWAALALVCLAQFMLILDVTVVNVALPDMAADLGLGREALTWAVTAYTLCFGGLMLLGGRLADAFGARRTLLAGLAVFTTASLVAGLADSAPQLLGGRIAQGVGAALLSPSALSIVTTTFHGAERNKALGVWAAIGGSGAAAGVLVGGALTDGPGWQWVFYVNVPVGLLVMAALPAFVTARALQPARLDVPGALLVTGGTGALIYGLVEAGDAGWADPATLLPLAGAVVAYVLFAIAERASQAPLMDLRMFTRRPVLAGAFLMLTATALLIAFFFLGSVYLQHLRGFSALKAGLFFLPVAVATGIGAHLGSRFVGRIGSRTTAVTGMLIAAVGTAPLTRLSETGNVYAVLLPGFAVASLGIGAVLVTATTTALAMVDHHEAGLASGVVNTFHEVGGSIGVAVVSTVAASGIERGTVGGFTDAFTVCAVAAAASAAVALGLVPRGKPQVTGGPHVH
ncbi:EmrB/QacA subfamily drug resistance transporter [Streptomyces sp. SAI-133]|uniref:MFS transporter n=1 Tax=unclassified Streptomyces TaxID=2593676 RepID=UPI00247579DF|nr:MFS transporter [Streptomyces sp. SAI-133]MDH6589907.1 EmrB/QacA subfamily drug resistance transporter [Streptomyces sp. SAI-133]